MVGVQGVSSLTGVHVVHGAQHVVGGTGQAADAEAAVGALVPGVSTGGEQEYIHNIVEVCASLHDHKPCTIVPLSHNQCWASNYSYFYCNNYS